MKAQGRLCGVCFGTSFYLVHRFGRSGIYGDVSGEGRVCANTGFESTLLFQVRLAKVVKQCSLAVSEPSTLLGLQPCDSSNPLDVPAPPSEPPLSR